MSTQIMEDYVSFETAKSLKENGFDEECKAFYYKGILHETNRTYVFDKLANSQLLKQYGDWEDVSKYVMAPTLQMAMKWLREQNRIVSIVHGYITNKYRIIITQSNELDITNLGNTLYCSNDYDYFSYEEACEAAIKYCLENLI